MTGWFLLAALLLLIANAFFVAVEFALLASRVTRLEPMAEDDDRRAAIALASIKDLQSQLAGAQLGITMASLGLGFVAEPAIATLIESAIESFVEIPSNVLHAISFTLALSLVVVVHMVIGEMVPKNIAIATPERSARILAPIHRVYVKLFAPIVWFLTAVSNGITRLLGMEPADELNTALTVNEFHRVIEGAVEEGKLEDLEHDLLDRALDFRARTAGSIMVPHSRMVTAPVDLGRRSRGVGRRIGPQPHPRHRPHARRCRRIRALQGSVAFRGCGSRDSGTARDGSAHGDRDP